MQKEDGLEISATDEFDANLATITSRIQAESEMPPQGQMQFSSLQKSTAGLTSVLNVVLPSQRVKYQKPKDLLFISDPVKPQEELKVLTMAESKIETDELIIGKGIANALKVFRERGMLGAQK